ncbi:Uncharacterised protein [Serratia fonticola]|uniref:Glyoxalase/fosfomycin resistance/dioxygenase domain-containing protein n=1 Tax=Serratia fonticola TaxID=47917 RepID=A0A4V6KPI0_SERFO|nr:Uncharacterised protein [Serratia fonticola]
MLPYGHRILRLRSASGSAIFNGVAGGGVCEQEIAQALSRALFNWRMAPRWRSCAFLACCQGGKVRKRVGWAHIALSLGSEALVDELAQRAKQEGILQAAPRWTGDGFYEAIIRDPDGNAIEITA